MSMRRDDLTAGQKTLRSLGLTVIVVTGLFAAGIAYSYLFGGQGSGWKQVASAAGLAAAAVAVFAMLADTIDYWMLGRRMTPFSLKMTRSLIFVAMLVAVVLSVVGEHAGAAAADDAGAHDLPLRRGARGRADPRPSDAPAAASGRRPSAVVRRPARSAEARSTSEGRRGGRRR